MNTDLTYKKTPHAVCNTIHGTIGVDLVHAWCFEHGDVNDRLLKKWIPKAQCYVKAGLQDLPDYLFKNSDIRKHHVDVWNEKAKNYKRCGKFKTNYEIKEYIEEKQLEQQSADILLNSFV